MGKKSGVTVLVSSQTAVKGGHGFEITVRMDNLHGRDWGEIQNKANRVRSMHSRSSSFSVVFMCLISATQKFKLEKNTLNTKERGKSRFDEILEVGVFILDYFVAPAFCLIPVREGSIFLLLHNAWQRNLKKRLLIPILYMFDCLDFLHYGRFTGLFRLMSPVRTSYCHLLGGNSSNTRIAATNWLLSKTGKDSRWVHYKNKWQVDRETT